MKISTCIRISILMIILLTGISIGSGRVTTQDTSSIELVKKPNGLGQNDTLRYVTNKAFRSGEYCTFDVNYGFITAGEAVLKVSDTIYHQRKCFHVEFQLNSKPFFDAFYKVRDRYVTVIDANGMFPWRFEQHIREGGYTRDFIAEFDQLTHRVTTTDKKLEIPSYVQDIMSAFYFARTVDFTNFRPGEKIHLQNFYKDSTYELDVKFKGKETIEVDAGEFRCVIIEPLVKEGGLFKSEGRILVWLTDDERHLPVKVTAKIIIGSVEAELTGYRGIAGPINSKVE
jgi:hypothetical protein